MQTYDCILAMKEENQSMELEPFNYSDFSSDESTDFDSSPERPTFVSRFICSRRHRTNQNPTRLSIRIDGNSEPSTVTSKQGFRASIDPWKLIKMSKEKAMMAAEKAREKLKKQKPMMEYDSLKPLPLETKSGPLMNGGFQGHPDGFQAQDDGFQALQLHCLVLWHHQSKSIEATLITLI